MATIIISLSDDPNIQRFVHSTNHFCELLEVLPTNGDDWVEQILNEKNRVTF